MKFSKKQTLRKFHEWNLKMVIAKFKESPCINVYVNCLRGFMPILHVREDQVKNKHKSIHEMISFGNLHPNKVSSTESCFSTSQLPLK